MDRGLVVFHGDSANAIKSYEDLNTDSTQSLTKNEIIIWDKRLAVESIDLVPDQIETGDQVCVRIRYRSDTQFELGALLCNLKSATGVLVANYDSNVAGSRLHLLPGTNEILINLGHLSLTRGNYIFSIGAYDLSRKVSYFHAPEHKVLYVDGKMVTTAFLQMGATL